MTEQITSVQKTNQNPMPEEVIQGNADRYALEILTPALMALPDHEVRKVTVLAPHAVAVGRHYARCYAQDRSVFAQGLNPSVWIPQHYDNMELRAKALWEADLALEDAIKEDEIVTDTATKARQMKNKLFRTAQYLWGDDAKKMDKLTHVKSGGSHLDLADDVFTLYHLFMDNIEDAKSRSDVTEVMLKEAADLGDGLLDVIGPSRDERIRAARDLRNRAAEYLFQGIDDIRTAAYFLFRKDPKALDRYPGLYAGRNKRRNNGKNSHDSTGEESPQNPVSSEIDSEVANEKVE